MVVNAELQQQLNVEIAVRQKKRDDLEDEIKTLFNALKIIVGNDPELEKLLDEELRIEANAKSNQAPQLRH